MKKTKSGWTIFLDRDGVINQRRPDDYVKSWNEFRFLPGVLKTLKVLKPICDHLFIVTNQQGIAKGVMTEQALWQVHARMKKVIRKQGGHVDAIYYCPASSSQTPSCRKPNPWMGYRAKKEFPSINFKKSVMVGDSISDIEFGKNLQMITVYIHPEVINPGQADYVCKDLMDFYRIFASRISRIQNY